MKIAAVTVGLCLSVSASATEMISVKEMREAICKYGICADAIDYSERAFQANVMFGMINCSGGDEAALRHLAVMLLVDYELDQQWALMAEGVISGNLKMRKIISAQMVKQAVNKDIVSRDIGQQMVKSRCYDETLTNINLKKNVNGGRVAR